MAADNDPVVASYDVVLNRNSTDSRLLILQYPAHRPSSRPYNAAKIQKPQSLRLKPNTGLVELEVPMLMKEHYNADAGMRYAKALSESRIAQVGASHGLSGGFNSNATQYSVPLQQDPSASQDEAREDTLLQTQVLGGKIAQSSERDPIYFLASFEGGTLHLSHLNAVVQMRPQLHHIDAEDENNHKRFQPLPSAAVGGKPESEQSAPRLESRAIEVKVKENKDDPRDRALNEGARLLRSIQAETWTSHEWIDADEEAAHVAREMLAPTQAPLEHTLTRPLRSGLSNGDWLDRMSAPREDGKKGLLAKLRGRERERARRKKAEEEKKVQAKASAASSSRAGHVLEQSSDGDLSSLDESDDEAEPHAASHESVGRDRYDGEQIEIKQEADVPLPTQEHQRRPARGTAVASPRMTKGRLRKDQPGIDVED